MNKESRLQEAYLSRLEKQRRKIMAARILLALAFFLLWETAADRGWIDSFFSAAPQDLADFFSPCGGTAASFFMWASPSRRLW